MSSFAFQKISWWFAWRGSRFLFSFHDVLYRHVSSEAVSDRATPNRLASIIICLSCRSVKNSFLDLLWIIAFFLFRIIFVRFRETFSLKVRVWVLNEFNRLLINFFMVCLERQHLIVFISRGALPARQLRSRKWSSDSKSAGLKSGVYLIARLKIVFSICYELLHSFCSELFLSGSEKRFAHGSWSELIFFTACQLTSGGPTARMLLPKRLTAANALRNR